MLAGIPVLFHVPEELRPIEWVEQRVHAWLESLGHRPSVLVHVIPIVHIRVHRRCFQHQRHQFLVHVAWVDPVIERYVECQQACLKTSSVGNGGMVTSLR